MSLPPEPTERFPYRLEKRVGVGSMGVVYQARDVSLDRTVAIKTLRTSLLQDETPETQAEMRQRFLQEAQAAGRLSHPGITTIFRVGQIESTPFMVMEWLDGQSLEEVLRRRERLPVHEVARLGVDLLDALDDAHRSGIVHRDIKPSNVMLLHNGRLKVTDFGIARIQGRELVKTQAGVVLATPKFAAPEQLRGSEVDPRADVWATGVLLYVLLTGDHPFEGSTFMELAHAVLSKEPTPLRQLVSDLPPTFESIVATALRKDRGERYTSAAQMADDLRPFASTESKDPTLPSLETARLPRTDSGSDRSQAPPPAPAGPTAPDGPTAPAEPPTPTLRHLPRDAGQVLIGLAETWPRRDLEAQPSRLLLERLLDRPLHAPAFAGAVRCGDVWLFLEDGVLLGAIDARDGVHGDAAVARLPATVQPRLHVPARELPERLVSVATSMLHPPRLLHADLDSSYVDLVALARKLRDERFDGIFRLQRGDDEGRVLFVDGEPTLALFSEGWEGVPIESPWSQWIAAHALRAQVEKRTLQPPLAWYRHAFRNVAFDLQPLASDGASGSTSDSSSSRLRSLFSSSATRTAAHRPGLAKRLRESSQAEVGGVDVEEAPAVRLLEWMSSSLESFFAERSLTSSWRYLADWVPLIRRAVVHHDLPRPGGRDTDFFDIVTFDDDDKALHLVHRLQTATVESFEAALQRAIDAKSARTKTGDVGGVLLVAPSFPDAVLESYRTSLQTASSGSWFSVEESFTGYAGFVRIGARRGFHLLLVEDRADGFAPILL